MSWGMESRESVLMDMGLSKNEAKAYVSLIEIGASTVTKISNKSKVHRTNLYEALERLKKKGIVSAFTKNGTVHFEATDPKIFFNFLKEREMKLNSVMPQLLLAKKMSTPDENIEIREGLTAVKATFSDALKHNQPIYTFGSPKEASGLAKIFLDRFHKERIKKKIPMYHIYNSDAEARIKELKKLPYTHVRTLAPEFNSPIATGICGDEVALKIWDKKDGMAIVIKSERIAKAYKKYFDLLYSVANPA